MKHEMKLKDIYFDKIKNEEKVYEIRLNDDKRKLIRVGDIIVFKREQELIECITTKVTDLIHFVSFEEMAKSLPLEKVGFENKGIKEVVEIYHQFYNEEDEKNNGVLAIKVQVVK